MLPGDIRGWPRVLAFCMQFASLPLTWVGPDRASRGGPSGCVASEKLTMSSLRRAVGLDNMVKIALRTQCFAAMSVLLGRRCIGASWSRSSAGTAGCRPARRIPASKEQVRCKAPGRCRAQAPMGPRPAVAPSATRSRLSRRRNRVVVRSRMPAPLAGRGSNPDGRAASERRAPAERRSPPKCGTASEQWSVAERGPVAECCAVAEYGSGQRTSGQSRWVDLGWKCPDPTTRRHTLLWRQLRSIRGADLAAVRCRAAGSAGGGPPVRSS